jgi:glycine reductase
MEQAGLPAVLITALPSIAAAAGANRIVKGVAIAHPLGDPSLSLPAEVALRKRIMERALEMLSTPVEPQTVWEVPGVA